MNGRAILALILVALSWFLLDMLLHEVLLEPVYAATEWTPQSELALGLVGVIKLVFSTTFVLLYAQWVRPKSLGAGVLYGALLGLASALALAFGSYTYMLLPATVAWSWFVGMWVESIIGGAIVGGLVHDAQEGPATDGPATGAPPAEKTKTEDRPRPAPAPQPAAPPRRSDAVTLLETLQREARLVDFLQEDLTGYADDQVGAAARQVHGDAKAVIERIFGIVPLLEEAEQATVEVPRGYDPGCYRLTGAVEGEPPYRGTLAHHGWKASRCEMPTWSGGKAARDVVAPAEVEVS